MTAPLRTMPRPRRATHCRLSGVCSCTDEATWICGTRDLIEADRKKQQPNKKLSPQTKIDDKIVASL